MHFCAFNYKPMKTLLTLTLLCFGIFAQAQIPSYVPTNGLVCWWPFNGNANDESGNGNHGTVNGATLAVDRFGNAGKAYSFDGVNDYIELPGIPLFNNFTITARFNSNSNQTFQNIMSKYDAGGGYALLFGNNGGLYAHTGFSFGNNACITNFIKQVNIWHLVTMTYNNGSLLFFIDSSLIYSCSNINVPTQNNSNTYIGRAAHSMSEFFSGILDDIAIYNRALSAAEVQQFYLGACAKPTFTAQPQNKSVAQGQTTTFAVQVDSASSFQWQMDNGFGFVNLVNSSLFSGVGTSSLTVKGSNSIDGYAFRCIATSCQADTSNEATLTVTSSASAAAGSVAGVPGLINYQGSALDSAGKPLKNQTISLKLSVLDSSSSGAAVFVESHTAATNGSGHFTIQIGGGTANLGTFDSVGWSNGRNKYLKTELSQNGTWVNLGTSQLVSVPYALHAGSAEKAKSANEATSASFFKDSLGNAYQIITVNGQPTLVPAPGSVSNPGSFACGQAVTYAGESYPTVQIGTQCWFQKNLNVGTMILGANDQTNNSTLEKYCYNNDPSNCAIYGGLYQWAEAVQYQNGASNTASPSPAFSGNVKGICPTGWHMPSDGEWCTLTTFLDSTVNCSVIGWTGTNAGGKMKSISGLWSSPNSGASNSGGFSILPSGYRMTNGTFYDINNLTLVWSSSENSNSNVIPLNLVYYSPRIYQQIIDKINGFPIRCLKD
ncbi:MAG: hypothetical protein RIS99_225 [Bacteroidota bacterium]